MRSRRGWARWLVPALVLLLTLKTTWGALGTFDVGLDDETVYLEAAHWAGKRYLPLADSSPLYPLWYRALSYAESDPVRLYYLNWFVLTASLPPLFYALARRSGASLAAAAWVAAAWSMSTSVMTWPFVSKFAVLVLGLGALAATAIRDRALAVAVSAVAMTAAAYARAELAMPSIVFTGLIALWSAVRLFKTMSSPAGPRRRRARERSALALGLCVVAPLALRELFGDPHQGGRAFFAFGQHYALNVVESKQLHVDPWTLWDRFARASFPHATTIGEALKENPRAVGWHVHRNVMTLRPALARLVRPLDFIPANIADAVWVGLEIVVVVGALSLVTRRARLDRRLASWLPLLFFVSVPTAAAALLIYPREHYLLAFAGLSLVALASGSQHARWPAWLRPRWSVAVPRLVRPRPRMGAGILVSILTLLIVALPTRGAALPSLLAGERLPPAEQDNRRTIELLRSLHLSGHVVILESDHSRGVYAELDFDRVAQWDKNVPFWRLVHERQIDVVVINQRLTEDPRFKSDPEFGAFVDGTGQREDFEFIVVPRTQVVVAVRARLLSGSSP